MIAELASQKPFQSSFCPSTPPASVASFLISLSSRMPSGVVTKSRPVTPSALPSTNTSAASSPFQRSR